MSKNIKIDKTVFFDINYIEAKDAESNGKHYFYDTSEADASESDLAEGKIGYANGAKVIGTYVKPDGDLTVRTNGTYDISDKKNLIIEIEGGYEPSYQEKTATALTETQQIVADEGYEGLSKVTVAGDENLIPENIKKDVELFGVVGTFEGSGKIGNFYVRADAKPSSNGVSFTLFGETAPKFLCGIGRLYYEYNYNITLSNNCNKISDEAYKTQYNLLKGFFSNNDFASLKTIGNYAFYNQSLLTVFDFPEVTTLDAVGYQFAICAAATTINLPKVASIPTHAFDTCTNLAEVTLGSEGNGVAELVGDAFANTTSNYTLTIFTTGDNVDTFETDIRNYCTTCNIVFKASEETTYNGNIVSAGDVITVVDSQ